MPTSATSTHWLQQVILFYRNNFIIKSLGLTGYLIRSHAAQYVSTYSNSGSKVQLSSAQLAVMYTKVLYTLLIQSDFFQLEVSINPIVGCW